MNSNLKAETMDAAGDMGVERRSTERRSAAYMIQATNYELAIRERDEALAKVAQLEARQAPIQSAELTANKLTECRHCGFYVALNRAPADAAPAHALTDGDITSWAKWIVRERKEYHADHACAQCRPESEIVVPGFVCQYHQALAHLARKG